MLSLNGQFSEGKEKQEATLIQMKTFGPPNEGYNSITKKDSSVVFLLFYYYSYEMLYNYLYYDILHLHLVI